MHLIVCIDTRDGMSFCGRRQSRDRDVVARILKTAEERRLWISPYSANLFAGEPVFVDPDYLEKAGEGEFCFAEIEVLPSCWDKLESVTLYHWNRSYPATVKFPREILLTMHLQTREEFPGHSHETITMERYVR